VSSYYEGNGYYTSEQAPALLSKCNPYIPGLTSEALLSNRNSLEALDSETVAFDVFSYVTLTLVVRIIPLYVMISSSDPVGETLRISVCWFRDPRRSFIRISSWLCDLNPLVPRVLFPYPFAYRSSYGVPDVAPELPKSAGNQRRTSGRKAGTEAQIMAMLVSTAPQTGRTV
jgi:hypothetical protein